MTGEVEHAPAPSTRWRKSAALAAAVVAIGALVTWWSWPSSPRSIELHGGTERFVLTIDVAAARPGDSDIDLRVTDRTGLPVQGLTIRLDATDPRMGYADPSVPAVDSGPGRYHAAAVHFMTPGPWSLDLTLYGPDGTDRTTVPLWISG